MQEKETLVLATNNRHKIEEISAIAEGLGFRVLSKREAGLEDFEVEEDGVTFEENAEKKARALYERLRCAALADDSGLVVDALDGAPGVYSSRYAGEEGNDAKNNEKLLKELEGLPPEQRTARFVCTLVLIQKDGTKITASGQVEGRILDAPRGSGGFGYDPLFLPDGFDHSFGEAPPAEKNAVSHRSRALRQLAEALRDQNG